MIKQLHFKWMLLLCALMVGSSSAWAQSEPGLSDFTWPDPIVDENFNSVATVSATATQNPASTTITKHGVFNGLYNNKTANTYGIENTTFGSNALFLTSGATTSPIIIGITEKSFGEVGAFSFKCKKANVGYIGMYGDGINGTAYAKANASCYVSVNNGTLSVSNGTSWKEVTTYTGDIEVCVIYNNSDKDAVYGNAISIAKQTAHFYVNGNLVKTGSAPKAMGIVNKAISSFRVVTTASSATMNVDDVKIYNELPTYKVPTKITSAEYATYCNEDYALDFSTTGITVYTATDTETSVTLNEVTSGKIPANTPVVLYKAGADGTAINVPVIASADAPAGTNDLHVSDGTAGTNQYVLAKKTNGVGFYPWTGAALSAGKIYLQAKGSYAAEYLPFDIDGSNDQTTGVEAIENSTLNNERSEVYNLNGQRVNQPTKGLYIVNGKKYIIK